MKWYEKKIAAYLVVLFILAILALYAFTIAPRTVQQRNMRLRKIQTQEIGQILSTDERFKDISFRLSTANLGRNIIVVCNIETKKDLEDLKAIMKEHIDPRFNIIYPTIEE